MSSEIKYSNTVNKELLIKLLENLYKATEKFPYSALAFILKPNDLLDLLSYFGGTTIEVPTKEEFTRLVQTCLVDAIGNYDLAKAANPEMLAGLSKARYEKLSKKLNSWLTK